jgi:anti-anti-sigma factor
MNGTTQIEAFTVTCGFLDGCRVLVLDGELDAAEAGTLDAAIDGCSDGLPVIVDMTSLAFIDSSGIHELLRERETGRPAAVVRTPGSNVARVLDIVELQNEIPMYDGLAAAVEGLDL